MKNNELTPQEKEFCRLLVLGKNKTEAYIGAGLLSDTAARKSACTLGCRLFNKVAIKAYYNDLLERIDKTEEKVLDDLAEKEKKAQEDFDCVQFFRDVAAGKVKDRGEEARLADRLKAAELDARIKQLLTNKTEVTGDFVIDVVIDDD